jgi:hypothetical protein
VKPAKAVLVIMRTGSFYGDTDIKNYLDGKYIGGNKDNCYFMTDVKPGAHYVTADGGNKDTVRMNFEAGRIYFLRQGVAPGVFRSFTQYSPMTLQDALHEAQAIDYVVYDIQHPGNDLSREDYEKEKKDYQEEAKKDPSHGRDIAQYNGSLIAFAGKRNIMLSFRITSRPLTFLLPMYSCCQESRRVPINLKSYPVRQTLSDRPLSAMRVKSETL